MNVSYFRTSELTAAVMEFIHWRTS